MSNAARMQFMNPTYSRQALFYTGYMLACIPGGYTASRAGGRLALPVALATWSAATFVAPLAAATVPTLSLTRWVWV